MKYIVKNAHGETVLETLIEDNARERAALPGYKLITVPFVR